MNAASLTSFRRAAGQTLRSIFPGTVTLDGRSFQAAVALQPVTLAIAGGGTTEHRTATVLISKLNLRDEPPIGSILVHEDREYTVNSITGREPFIPDWRLICIEKEHH